MGRPKKADKPPAGKLGKVEMWKGKPIETARQELVAQIQCGMPTVDEMRTQPHGINRKQKEWEVRHKPYLDELSQLEGRRVSAERFRPGR